MSTIFCLLEGENDLFAVKIIETQSVFNLMDEIKKEVSEALVAVKPYHLKLYHVNIELDESDGQHITRANEAFQDLSEHEPLKMWHKLSKIKEGFGFPDGFLHILVQLPPSESIHSRACGAITETHPPPEPCLPSIIARFPTTTSRFLPVPRSQMQLVPPVNARGKQISEWR